mgnify:CR=1 FL=1
MELNMTSAGGAGAQKVTVSDRIFSQSFNDDLVHQVKLYFSTKYGFTFDNTANDDDFRLPTATPVVVDAMSMQYLQGATVHYRDDAAGAAFVIENPNATSTCGCGSSFSA